MYNVYIVPYSSYLSLFIRNVLTYYKWPFTSVKTPHPRQPPIGKKISHCKILSTWHHFPRQDPGLRLAVTSLSSLPRSCPAVLGLNVEHCKIIWGNLKTYALGKRPLRTQVKCSHSRGEAKAQASHFQSWRHARHKRRHWNPISSVITPLFTHRYCSGVSRQNILARQDIRNAALLSE